MSDAPTILAQCDTLAGYSEEPDRLTRRFATRALRAAGEQVAEWMRAAGMTTRFDNAGNLIGRFACPDENAPTLLLGSHLDTVRDAGKYDGMLGVLLATACVARLRREGRALPFHIEVYGFADEEGLRFHTAYLGSSVVAGTLDNATLALTDPDGAPLAEAIRAAGGDPDMLAGDRRDRSGLLGYIETHIEQGPVLEAQGLPVGIVTAIQGQSRFDVGFSGTAGHAGTVPVALRHDALCAAAEFTLAVESLARETEGLVATVGQLAVYPGASNVIPGQATLSLDVRHPEDGLREAACARLRKSAEAIGGRRGAQVAWDALQSTRAVPCDERLAGLLATAVTEVSYPVHRLPSGAGHDAAIMAGMTGVAMLFVRCAGGISHSPLEAVTEGDVAVALDVLSRFVALLAAERGRP
ncbi:MAG TPA: allantoate amidohydrolase [Ktedonobacterales bacterium]|nr:allantoate amidohydrolase [Ktedonobacterales bacterium]